jgi:hypothetical protein
MMEQPAKTISMISEYSDDDSSKQIKMNFSKVVDATEGISINGKKMQKVPDISKQPGKSYFGQSQELAKDILEFLILKTRLELGNNDKKKIFKIKEDFLADCLSNITNFQVRLVTDFFSRDDTRLVSPNFKPDVKKA